MVNSAKFLKSRLPFLWLMLVAIALAGCSLSGPTGGGAPQTTFEGAPVVNISSPLPNATFLEGTVVNIMARIENAGPDVAAVRIELNGELVGEVANPNASGAAAFTITQSWPTSNQGQYTISVVATRADGTASTPATTSVTIIKQATIGNTGNDTTGNNNNDSAGSQASPTPQTSNTNNNQSPSTDNSSSSGSNTDTSNQTAPTARPTNTPAPPTNTPEPTKSPTPSKPMAVVVSGANLRKGPSTVFDPPVGSIAANQEAEILAVSPGRDWYKIRYYNSEAWIFASLVTTTGNVGSLPVDAGPPTPLPPTATPIPVPTATVVTSAVNLFVSAIQIDPHPLRCGKDSSITVVVGNNGTEGTTQGGRVKIEAILISNGSVLESTETVFGAIPAGGTTTSAVAHLTVKTNFDELQRIRVTVDSLGQIAESNEDDNASASGTDYSLAKSNCG